jgi:hypothetical protein
LHPHELLADSLDTVQQAKLRSSRTADHSIPHLHESNILPIVLRQDRLPRIYPASHSSNWFRFLPWQLNSFALQLRVFDSAHQGFNLEAQVPEIAFDPLLFSTNEMIRDGLSRMNLAYFGFVFEGAWPKKDE